MGTNSISTSQTKLLRANDVAQRLCISRSLAYQLLQRGDIPTVRFGSSVRVRECDLDEYIQRAWTGWNEG